MNRLLTLACLATTSGLAAQVAAPPWWGVADNDTVSLAWNFDNSANPYAPTFQVAPAWFNNPGTTAFTPPAGMVWINTLAGHTGVVGFTSPAPRTLSLGLQVDNDPRPNWIKIFWFQYDEFSTSTGKVSAAIREALQPTLNYQRATITETSQVLGNGWTRTTVSAQLIPQPWDEGIDWTLVETVAGSSAIDNLFVNSRCVIPPPDADGDALGAVDAQTLVNLDVATGNTGCTSACAYVTATGQRRIFVAARAAQPNTLQMYEVLGPTAATSIVRTGIATPPLPQVQDLALAELRGVGTRVVGIADLRQASTNAVVLVAVNPTLQPATFDNTFTVPLQQFPVTQGPYGLAFNPDGNLGAGSFWVSDPIGAAYEYSLQGVRLSTMTQALNGMPGGVVGAGYDRFTGTLYWLSRNQAPAPGGITLNHGFEHSLFDRQPTGVEFFGNLNLGSNPPGGTALGLEVYRRAGNDLRLLCVADLGTARAMYELRGPFRYGWSLEGRTGMQGGAPYRGNAQWGVTLTGVPEATFAMLYLGFNNTSYNGTPLPFRLGAVGLPETVLSVALDFGSTFRAVQGGRAAQPVPIPNLAAFSYVPTFYQWVILDPTAPGGFTLSQAGKTVLY